MVAALLMLVLAVPPRVVAASPDHGDAAVDPATKEVRIEFDQDMATGRWSVCGGGELFPKIEGTIRWESPRVLVVPVSLVSSHEYRISINCPSAQGTRSATGEPAEVTPIWFRTAKDGASAVSVSLSRDENKVAITDLEQAVREKYSYRDRVVKDWGAVWNEHRAALENATSRAGFAREAARALARAGDLHVSLMVGDADGWNVRFPTARRHVSPNGDANTLADIVPGFKKVSGRVQTGRYDDGTLYLSMNECSHDAAGEALQVLADAKEHGWVKQVVLDLRFNAGGDELAARRVAGVFVRQPRVYAMNRYREMGMSDGWGPRLDRVVEPAPEKQQLHVPVAVLAGPYCMSSCESFVMMLKGAAGAVVVGSTTFGSSGNPRPVRLRNGVTAWLSSWEDLGPDGSTIEGVGVPPDIEVRTESGDFQVSDPVLERALLEIRKK